MMTLRLMTTLIDTLHDGESQIANQIAAPWEPDAGSVRFFRASANFLFTMTIADQPYMLRFNHADERTSDTIRAEVDYLHFLADEGIDVPRILRSKAGSYVESISTELGTFHAVVFERMMGPQRELDELTTDGFVTWGAALGKLHNAAQRYHGTGRSAWQDHLAWVAASLPADEQSARRALSKLQGELNKLPVTPQNFGLIHYDFELDNVLWNAHGLSIIDFDDCAHYWFIADVAYALRDLADDSADQVDLADVRLAAFIEGYRTARELSQSELALIQLFLRVHHLILLTKLRRTLNLEQQADESSWVTNLHQKLLARIQRYREELAAYAN
ncbi:MAG: phosphotransferase [Anaerolineae bacterium]|nr:phosphotransferase [Anaerolineae bacterium]